MRFLLDTEQRAFADSLDARLKAADTPSVVRDWSRGEHGGGRALWRELAEAGVFALAVPEEYGGFGPRPVELAVAFIELGRHAVPGPLVETVASAALLTRLGDPGPAGHLLPALASGEATATLAPADGGPLLDADVADVRLVVSRRFTGPELRLASAPTAPPRRSLDPARRLFRPPPGGELLATGPRVTVAAAHALTWARLATAAQALGTGLALLDRTVAYAVQRTQFGVPIGTFQTVRHRLADARIALEFARPLLFGAALTLAPADVAAAKVTACEAAYTTARTALQLHGAIGYTTEYDLSLWLTKARALLTAWGTPSRCRAAVLDEGSGL
ncbi:acyl-CoA dehydrogenase family protein [Streptomyces sp. YIM S03343]